MTHLLNALAQTVGLVLAAAFCMGCAGPSDRLVLSLANVYRDGGDCWAEWDLVATGAPQRITGLEVEMVSASSRWWGDSRLAERHVGVEVEGIYRGLVAGQCGDEPTRMLVSVEVDWSYTLHGEARF